MAEGGGVSQIALDAGSTYSCVANQTVGSVTSSDSAVVAFTTELLPPNITSPLAGATGVPRVDGNVTLFVAVDAGSSVVSARCTRLDTLTSVSGSAPIALGTGSTMVSIAVEAGWAYSCVANQTAGSVTSSDSAEVEFTTELLPPNITSPLAGATGVGREGGNVTLTLAVDAAASSVSLMCTRSDTLSATATSVAIAGNSNHATVSIALEAGRTYSCVANQTVGSVTSSDSAAVAFTTELLAPNITSPLAGATGVAREGGNVTLTLAVDAAASAASIHCTRTDSLSTVETSSAIVPNDGLAAVSIALDAGSTYSCVANQTVGSVTSSDSAAVAFTTELLPPNITSPLAGATGVPRVDGNVTLFVAVDAGSSVVSARCTRLDTLTSVSGGAPIALGTGSTMVSIAVEAGRTYSCVANQTAGSVTSSDSAEVEFTTELLPPNITSPLAGAMGVGREGGNVTLTLAVDAAASAVSLMCTRSDTLSATATSVAIAGNSNHATVSIALEAGRTYSCVANQTVGSVTSSDSAAVAFTTELLAPNITSPLAGATGVPRAGGNVTLTLAVDAEASAASVLCTRTDTLESATTTAAIAPSGGLANVSIALEAGRAYSCVANQSVGTVTSSDSELVAFTTEVGAPAIVDPLAGATGVERVGGNVTLTLEVENGATEASVRCTRSDTLLSVTTSAAIAPTNNRATVSIALEAGRTYSCVANQTVGGVTSIDSGSVTFTTALSAPNITSPLAGATGVKRADGKVTLTLAVDDGASVASVRCTRTDTLSAVETSGSTVSSGGQANVLIALEAGRAYSCVANQTVGSVTSRDSAAVAFTTEVAAPVIVHPLAGATGVERVDGNVTLTLAVDAAASTASVRCMPSDTGVVVSASASIAPSGGLATFSIALEAGQMYSCAANQTVGSVTSGDSAPRTFTVSVPSPTLRFSMSGDAVALDMSGVANVTVFVHGASTRAAVLCAALRGASVSSSVVVDSGRSNVSLQIPLQFDTHYKCYANQSIGSVASDYSSALVIRTQSWNLVYQNETYGCDYNSSRIDTHNYTQSYNQSIVSYSGGIGSGLLSTAFLYTSTTPSSFTFWINPIKFKKITIRLPIGSGGDSRSIDILSGGLTGKAFLGCSAYRLFVPGGLVLCSMGTAGFVDPTIQDSDFVVDLRSNATSGHEARGAAVALSGPAISDAAVRFNLTAAPTSDSVVYAKLIQDNSTSDPTEAGQVAIALVGYASTGWSLACTRLRVRLATSVNCTLAGGFVNGTALASDVSFASPAFSASSLAWSSATLTFAATASAGTDSASISLSLNPSVIALPPAYPSFPLASALGFSAVDVASWSPLDCTARRLRPGDFSNCSTTAGGINGTLRLDDLTVTIPGAFSYSSSPQLFLDAANASATLFFGLTTASSFAGSSPVSVAWNSSVSPGAEVVASQPFTTLDVDGDWTLSCAAGRLQVGATTSCRLSSPTGRVYGTIGLADVLVATSDASLVVSGAGWNATTGFVHLAFDVTAAASATSASASVQVFWNNAGVGSASEVFGNSGAFNLSIVGFTPVFSCTSSRLRYPSTVPANCTLAFASLVGAVTFDDLVIAAPASTIAFTAGGSPAFAADGGSLSFSVTGPSPLFLQIFDDPSGTISISWNTTTVKTATAPLLASQTFAIIGFEGEWRSRCSPLRVRRGAQITCVFESSITDPNFAYKIVGGVELEDLVIDSDGGGFSIVSIGWSPTRLVEVNEHYKRGALAILLEASMAANVSSSSIAIKWNGTRVGGTFDPVDDPTTVQIVDILPGVRELDCGLARLHGGGTGACRLSLAPGSVIGSIAGGDFVLGSSPAGSSLVAAVPTVTSTENSTEISFAVVAYLGSTFSSTTVTLSWNPLQVGSVNLSSPSSVPTVADRISQVSFQIFETNFTCAGQARLRRGQSKTCTIEATLGHPNASDFEVAVTRPSGHDRALWAGLGTGDVTQNVTGPSGGPFTLVFTAEPGQTLATDVNLTLSYVPGVGGALIAFQPFTLFDATFACDGPLRLRLNSTKNCTATATLGTLATTDFVFSYTDGLAVSRAVYSLGPDLVVEMVANGTEVGPTGANVTLEFDASVGDAAVVSGVQQIALVATSVNCTSAQASRIRRGGVTTCGARAPLAALLPEDFVVVVSSSALQVSLVPAGDGSGALTLNVTADALQEAHTAAAVDVYWAQTVGNSAQLLAYSYQIFDANFSCATPLRLARAKRKACTVAATFGSINASDFSVAGSVSNAAVLLVGPTGPLGSSLAVELLADAAQTSHDSVEVTLYWAEEVGGRAPLPATQTVAIFDAGLNCTGTLRLRRGGSKNCTIAPLFGSFTRDEFFDVEVSNPSGRGGASTWTGAGSGDLTVNVTDLADGTFFFAYTAESAQTSFPNVTVAVLWVPGVGGGSSTFSFEIFDATFACDTPLRLRHGGTKNCTVTALVGQPLPQDFSTVTTAGLNVATSLTRLPGSTSLYLTLLADHTQTTSNDATVTVSFTTDVYDFEDPAPSPRTLAIFDASFACASPLRLRRGGSKVCTVTPTHGLPIPADFDTTTSLSNAAVTISTPLGGGDGGSFALTISADAAQTAHENVTVTMYWADDVGTKAPFDAQDIEVFDATFSCAGPRLRRGGNRTCTVTATHGRPIKEDFDGGVITDAAGAVTTAAAITTALDGSVGGPHTLVLTADASQVTVSDVTVTMSWVAGVTAGTVQSPYNISMFDATFACDTPLRLRRSGSKNCTVTPVVGYPIPGDFITSATAGVTLSSLSSLSDGSLYLTMTANATQNETETSIVEVRFTTAVFDTEEVLASSQTITLFDASFACDAPLRLRRSGTKSCTISPVFGHPIPADFVTAATGGVSLSPLSLPDASTGAITLVVTADASQTTYTSTTVTITFAAYVHGVATTVPFPSTLQLFDASFACASPLRLRRGGSKVCTVTATHGTPVRADFDTTTSLSNAAVSISSNLTGSDGGPFALTISADAAQTAHENVTVTMYWADDVGTTAAIDPQNIEVFDATFSCAGPRLRRGGNRTCTVTATHGRPIKEDFDGGVITDAAGAVTTAAAITTALDGSVGGPHTLVLTADASQVTVSDVTVTMSWVAGVTAGTVQSPYNISMFDATFACDTPLRLRHGGTKNCTVTALVGQPLPQDFSTVTTAGLNVATSLTRLPGSTSLYLTLLADHTQTTSNDATVTVSFTTDVYDFEDPAPSPRTLAIFDASFACASPLRLRRGGSKVCTVTPTHGLPIPADFDTTTSLSNAAVTISTPLGGGDGGSFALTISADAAQTAHENVTVTMYWADDVGTKAPFDAQDIQVFDANFTCDFPRLRRGGVKTCTVTATHGRPVASDFDGGAITDAEGNATSAVTIATALHGPVGGPLALVLLADAAQSSVPAVTVSMSWDAGVTAGPLASPYNISLFDAGFACEGPLRLRRGGAKVCRAVLTFGDAFLSDFDGGALASPVPAAITSALAGPANGPFVLALTAARWQCALQAADLTLSFVAAVGGGAVNVTQSIAIVDATLNCSAPRVGRGSISVCTLSPTCGAPVYADYLAPRVTAGGLVTALGGGGPAFAYNLTTEAENRRQRYVTTAVAWAPGVGGGDVTDAVQHEVFGVRLACERSCAGGAVGTGGYVDCAVSVELDSIQAGDLQEATLSPPAAGTLNASTPLAQASGAGPFRLRWHVAADASAGPVELSVRYARGEVHVQESPALVTVLPAAFAALAPFPSAPFGGSVAGQRVTLLGANLLVSYVAGVAPVVTLGNASATSVQHRSGAELSFVAPAAGGNAAGVPVELTVASPCFALRAPAAFRWNPPTSCKGLEPYADGPAAGGGAVRAVVGDLEAGDVVRAFVGGRDAGPVNVTAAGHAELLAPAAGPLAPDAPHPFELRSTLLGPSPGTITRLVPDNGPLAGGNVVTVEGTNLAGSPDNVTVSVGGCGPVAPLAASRTAVVFVACAGAAALDGREAVVLSARFGAAARPAAYFFHPGTAPSAITAVEPSSGPPGSVVTIIGTDLTDMTEGRWENTRVLFGGRETRVAGPIAGGATASSLVVVVPEGGADGELVDVAVRSRSHGSAARPAAFRYRLTPGEVFAVEPNNGPAGATITVTGARLAAPDSTAANVTVAVGGLAATVLSANATRVVAALPAAGLAAGPPLDVAVTDALLGRTTAHGAFRFNPTGTSRVTGVSPASGPAAGGNAVTVSGEHLCGPAGSEADARVAFGAGLPAPATCLAAGPASALLVAVPPASEADLATAPAPLAVAAARRLTPRSAGHRVGVPGVGGGGGAGAGAGVNVTVAGFGLGGAAGVTLAGVPAAALLAANDTALLVAPGRPRGGGGARLGARRRGEEAATPLLFRYFAGARDEALRPRPPRGPPRPRTPPSPVRPAPPRPRPAPLADARAAGAPVLFGVEPEGAGAGPPEGGTAVTVRGAGFVAGPRLRCAFRDDHEAVSVPAAFLSAARVACVAPPRRNACRREGAVELLVSNDGAAWSAPLAFRYERAPPALAALEPAAAPLSGGALVTVYGAGFRPSPHLKCRFEGAPVLGGLLGSEYVNATWLSARAVACAAPAVAHEALAAVRVNQGPLDPAFDSPAALPFAFRRLVPSVSGVSAGEAGEPPRLAPPVAARVPLAGGATLTVTGANFANTAALRCRFGDRPDSPSVAATYAGPTRVLCPAPPAGAAGRRGSRPARVGGGVGRGRDGSAGAPFRTLARAIDAALPVDTVRFGPGRHAGEGNSGVRSLGKRVTVVGEPGAVLARPEALADDAAAGLRFVAVAFASF
eukprot:tig00000478_g1259.t1